MAKEYKFEGKNVQSAIETGLGKLGLRRDQVEVSVLAEGSQGFLGLGAKPAVVKITERIWKTAQDDSQPEQDDSNRRQKSGKGGSGRSRGSDRKPAQASAQRPARTAQAQKPAQKQKENRGYSKPAPQTDDIESARKVISAVKEIVSAPQPRPEPIPEPEHSGHYSEQTTLRALEPIPAALEPAAKKAAETLTDIVKGLGVSVSNVTAEWDNVQERIFVKFDCDNANLVIGRDGQTLEAIQYLVTLIVSRHTEHHAVVQADTANYWKNQEDKIISDLNYGIDSVRRSGQLYRLAAMNPAHRRFVHKHLADHPDVETTSEGEGNWRKVVLRPKKH